jgi:hypothetical protein
VVDGVHVYSKQDAELAAAKQEFATRLAAHQDLQGVRPANCSHILPCKILNPFKQAMKTIHQNSALHVQ